MRHGHRSNKSRSPEYYVWEKMKERCYNPNHRRYAYYGGRGIRVCAHWHSFQNFLADMGKRPRNKTLDRMNVDGHYCPGNCRWATGKQQANNQRHGNQHLGRCTMPTVCSCGIDTTPCLVHPTVLAA